MSRLEKLGLGAGGLLLALFAFIGVEYTVRGTPLVRVTAIGDHGGPPAVSDSLFERTMELFTGTRLEPGNQIEILANGNQTYPRLWQDLRAARQSITLQMYYCTPGRAAVTLGSFCRNDPAAALRGLANWRTVLSSKGSPLASERAFASSISRELSAVNACFSI